MRVGEFSRAFDKNVFKVVAGGQPLNINREEVDGTAGRECR
jgi:hypothetical protein